MKSVRDRLVPGKTDFGINNHCYSREHWWWTIPNLASTGLAFKVECDIEQLLEPTTLVGNLVQGIEADMILVNQQ